MLSQIITQMRFALRVFFICVVVHFRVVDLNGNLSMLIMCLLRWANVQYHTCPLHELKLCENDLCCDHLFPFRTSSFLGRTAAVLWSHARVIVVVKLPTKRRALPFRWQALSGYWKGKKKTPIHWGNEQFRLPVCRKTTGDSGEFIFQQVWN